MACKRPLDSHLHLTPILPSLLFPRALIGMLCQYVFHGDAEESGTALSGGARSPYFTSATNAEAWWRSFRTSEASGSDARPHESCGEWGEASVCRAWLQVGAYVEVKMDEEGLRSSRYQARILQLDGERVRCPGCALRLIRRALSPAANSFPSCQRRECRCTLATRLAPRAAERSL